MSEIANNVATEEVVEKVVADEVADEVVVEVVADEVVDEVVEVAESEVVKQWVSDANTDEFKGVMENLTVNDDIPQEVIEMLVMEVMKNTGSGCENPLDFANMLKTLYDSNKVKRTILTKLVIGPRNYKTFRTNIPLWIVRSYVRTDGGHSNIDFNGKTYSRKSVVASPAFMGVLNELADCLGSLRVKVIGAKTNKVNKVELEDVDDLFDSVDEIDYSNLIMFEFKRKVSNDEIDNWKSKNKRQANIIEKNEKLNQKNKDKKTAEKVVDVKEGSDSEISAHISSLESVCVDL